MFLPNNIVGGILGVTLLYITFFCILFFFNLEEWLEKFLFGFVGGSTLGAFILGQQFIRR